MLMIANWKMNMTKDEIASYLKVLSSDNRWGLWRKEGIRLLLCPPFPYLDFLRTECSRLNLPVGILAQNMCAFEKGAYTGEVSAAMLKDLGLDGVLLGHSERRQYFGETDSAVAVKTARALDFDLMPVVCFGETQEQRDSGACQKVWDGQISPVWEAVSKSRLKGSKTPVIWAYEPVWAIGTGRSAGLREIREVANYLRSAFGEDCAEGLLYGGSVNEESVSGLFEKGTVYGFLVGSAFRNPQTVLNILDRLIRKS